MVRFVAAAASSQMTENNIQQAVIISAGNEELGMKRDRSGGFGFVVEC
jgi:hypothetical protein